MNNLDKIGDYRIVELLSENSKSQIYRAFNELNNTHFIIKVLLPEYATSLKIYLFQKEFEILQSITSESIIRPIELITYNNLPIMVLEDFGGISLKQYISQPDFQKNTSIEDKIRLAIAITDAINNIHKNNFIHKDINPSNIVYNKDKQQLKIIDFGLATELRSEQFELSNYNTLQGTLAYISPEQTGRMNRNIDFRTDYYSMGISLYELFSGNLPFSAQTPREWIHCHIAKTPIPLHNSKIEIPITISKIIDKLLSKTVENRYQSAIGISWDLQMCLTNIKNSGIVEDFELGTKDISQKFEIPQKIYGRQSEINQLITTFDELPIWKSELVIIKGDSGIGKTCLVGELHKPVIEKNGYFIHGKFEELKRNTPYHGFIQALSSFIQHILSENDNEIARWKDLLLDELSENIQLIINVLPELEKITGIQPDVADLSAIESQNRFIVSFLKFVQCISKNVESLVFFLDDLQWADTASLEMLKNLLADTDDASIMIIGAYRTNEVILLEGIETTREKIEKSGVKVIDIDIKPLESKYIQEMLSDMFYCNIQESKELAELCFEKTHGNPYFLKEFLQDLYQKGCILVDEIHGKWTWNMNLVRNAKITDNVATILSNRIRSLSSNSQRILMQASCIGARFDLETISKIQTISKRDIILCLHDALDAGFIQPTDQSFNSLTTSSENNTTYKFVHDRIQNSAYALLDKSEQEKIHYQIGNYLLDSVGTTKIEEHIFAIVEHLNKGMQYVADSKIIQLAELNQLAARKSKSTAAFWLSFHYLQTATSLLKEDIWNTHYSFALEIYTDAAESAYLTGDYNLMEEFSTSILSNTKSITDIADLREIRILAFQAQHKHDAAISEAFAYLKLLGISINSKAGVPQLLKNLIHTNLILKKYDANKIMALPPVQNLKVSISMRIMGVLLLTLYDTNPVLFALVIFKILRLTLVYGVAPISPLSFMMYGMLKNVMLGQIQSGYEFGQIGLSLLKKINAKKYWAQISVCYNLGVRIWKEPIEKSIEGLLGDFKISLETGDISFAISSLATCTNYQFYKGDTLQQVMETAEKFKRSLAHIPYQEGMKVMDMQLQAIYNLQNTVENPEILQGKFFNEIDTLDIEQTNSHSANIYLLKMIICYCLNDYEKAYQFTLQGRKYVQSVAGILHYAMFHYYESLILLGNYNNLTKSQKKKALQRISKNYKIIKKWAIHAPSNFQNKLILLEAETERIKNNHTKISVLYDKSIELSKNQGFTSEEAIANECAAKYWITQNKPDFAAMYITRAYKLYEIWGAHSKLVIMLHEYSSFIQIQDSTISSQQTTNNTINTSTQNSVSSHSETSSMDIETVMEAAKTISQEIVLSRLFENILRIIIEHAGAESGVLLLNNSETNEIFVEARGNIINNSVSITIENEALEKADLPLSIIRFVNRTQQFVLLHDAFSTGNFIRDPYIKKNKIKSVVCIPIHHQSKLNGILYLENNQATEVFTENKIGIISLLCTQAAISIENARLYNSLEQKVIERTTEVVKQKEIIEAKNIEITDSIVYAKRIQSVVLPRSSLFEKLFSDYFILFKPKDIVSGDFYWLQEINNKKIIAVSDCTGHGVPGGFMSMLGSAFLNEIIVKNQISDPALALNKLRDEIISSLHQTKEFSEQKDGMDISLCVIDIEAMKLSFAGAYNSIFFIRSKSKKELPFESIASNNDLLLYEIKADKMPISIHDIMNSFTKIEIELCKDDIIILFSDGYKDQIGGPNDRKFLHKNFKNNILEYSNNPLSKMKDLLENDLHTWIYSQSVLHEQIDDITVLGIKI